MLAAFGLAFFLCSKGRMAQRWEGFVTDTHCGTHCQVTKDMTPEKECVERCVRKGSQYGLWVNHHVLRVAASEQSSSIRGTSCVSHRHA
jgi:hypothetical protein